MRDALDANTGALKPVGGTLAMLRVEKPVNIRDALLLLVLHENSFQPAKVCHILVFCRS